jgi:hypothetical protein
MINNRGRHRNSWPTNEVCHHGPPKGPNFFFLGDRVESVGFFWIFVVPNVLASTSQWVLNMFLKVLIMFPNIFPIASHILLTSNKFYSCSIYNKEPKKGRLQSIYVGIIQGIIKLFL